MEAIKKRIRSERLNLEQENEDQTQLKKNLKKHSKKSIKTKEVLKSIQEETNSTD